MINAIESSLLGMQTNRQNLERAQADFGAEAVSVEQILSADVDIVSPCAMGAILNAQSIPNIRASIIAGAANNQLATEADGQRVFDRNILYAPDYVINSGGITSVSLEYEGGKTEADVRAHIALVPGRLTDIFVASDDKQLPTNVIADVMAEQIVADATL